MPPGKGHKAGKGADSGKKSSITGADDLDALIAEYAAGNASGAVSTSASAAAAPGPASGPAATAATASNAAAGQASGHRSRSGSTSDPHAGTGSNAASNSIKPDRDELVKKLRKKAASARNAGGGPLAGISASDLAAGLQALTKLANLDLTKFFGSGGTGSAAVAGEVGDPRWADARGGVSTAGGNGTLGSIPAAGSIGGCPDAAWTITNAASGGSNGGAAGASLSKPGVAVGGSNASSTRGGGAGASMAGVGHNISRSSPSRPPAKDLSIRGRDLYLSTDSAWYPPQWKQLGVSKPWKDTSLPRAERISQFVRSILSLPRQYVFPILNDDPYAHLYATFRGKKVPGTHLYGHSVPKELMPELGRFIDAAPGAEIPSENLWAPCYFERSTGCPVVDAARIEDAIDEKGKVIGFDLNSIRGYILWIPYHSTGYQPATSRHLISINGAPYVACYVYVSVTVRGNEWNFGLKSLSCIATDGAVVATAPTIPELDSWPMAGDAAADDATNDWPAAQPLYKEDSDGCMPLLMPGEDPNHLPGILSHMDVDLLSPPNEWTESMYESKYRSIGERRTAWMRCQLQDFAGQHWGMVIPPARAHEWIGPRLVFSRNMTAWITYNCECVDEQQETLRKIGQDQEIPPHIVAAPVFVEYPPPLRSASDQLGTEETMFYFWAPKPSVLHNDDGMKDSAISVRNIHGDCYVRCVWKENWKKKDYDKDANDMGLSKAVYSWNIDRSKADMVPFSKLGQPYDLLSGKVSDSKANVTMLTARLPEIFLKPIQEQALQSLKKLPINSSVRVHYPTLQDFQFYLGPTIATVQSHVVLKSMPSMQSQQGKDQQQHEPMQQRFLEVELDAYVRWLMRAKHSAPYIGWPSQGPEGDDAASPASKSTAGAGGDRAVLPYNQQVMITPQRLRPSINSLLQLVIHMCFVYMSDLTAPIPRWVLEQVKRLFLLDEECANFYNQHDHITKAYPAANRYCGKYAAFPENKAVASKYWVANLNHFGNLGGYETVTARLTQDLFPAPASSLTVDTYPDAVNELSILTKSVCMGRWCFTKEWADRHLQPFRIAAFSRMAAFLRFGTSSGVASHVPDFTSTWCDLTSVLLETVKMMRERHGMQVPAAEDDEKAMVEFAATGSAAAVRAASPASTSADESSAAAVSADAAVATLESATATAAVASATSQPPSAADGQQQNQDGGGGRAPIASSSGSADRTAVPEPDIVIEGRSLYLRTYPSWYPSRWADIPAPTAVETQVGVESSRSSRELFLRRTMYCSQQQLVAQILIDDPYRDRYRKISGTKTCDVRAAYRFDDGCAEVDAVCSLEIGQPFPATRSVAPCYFERPYGPPACGDDDCDDNGDVLPHWLVWVPAHSCGYPGLPTMDSHVMLIEGAPYIAFTLSLLIRQSTTPTKASSASEPDASQQLSVMTAQVYPAVAAVDPLPVRTLGSLLPDWDLEPLAQPGDAAVAAATVFPPMPPDRFLCDSSPLPPVELNGHQFLAVLDPRHLNRDWFDHEGRQPWLDKSLPILQRAAHFARHHVATQVAGMQHVVVIASALAASYTGPRITTWRDNMVALPCQVFDQCFCCGPEDGPFTGPSNAFTRHSRDCACVSALSPGYPIPSDVVIAPVCIELPLNTDATMQSRSASSEDHLDVCIGNFDDSSYYVGAYHIWAPWMPTREGIKRESMRIGSQEYARYHLALEVLHQSDDSLALVTAHSIFIAQLTTYNRLSADGDGDDNGVDAAEPGPSQPGTATGTAASAGEAAAVAAPALSEPATPAAAPTSETAPGSSAAAPAAAAVPAPEPAKPNPIPVLPASTPRAPDLVVNGRDLYLQTDSAWFPPSWRGLAKTSPRPWRDKARPLDQRLALAIRSRLGEATQYVCALLPDDPYAHTYRDITGVKSCEINGIGVSSDAAAKRDALMDLGMGEAFPENNGCVPCYFERPGVPIGKVDAKKVANYYVLWVPLYSACYGWDISYQHTMMIDDAPYGAVYLQFSVTDVEIDQPLKSVYIQANLSGALKLDAPAEPVVFPEFDSWPEGLTWPPAPSPRPIIDTIPAPYILNNGVKLMRHFDQHMLPIAWADNKSEKPWKDPAKPKRERATAYARWSTWGRSGISWSVVIPPSKEYAYEGPTVSYKHAYSSIIRTTDKRADADLLAKQDAWNSLKNGSDVPSDMCLAPVYIEYPTSSLVSVVPGKDICVFRLWVPALFVRAAIPDSRRWERARVMEIEGAKYVRCVWTETVKESNSGVSEEGFTVKCIWEIEDGTLEFHIPVDTDLPNPSSSASTSGSATAASALSSGDKPKRDIWSCADIVANGRGFYVEPVPSWIPEVPSALKPLCECKKSGCGVCNGEKELTSILKRLVDSTRNKAVISGSDLHEILSTCVKTAVWKCFPNAKDRGKLQRTILMAVQKTCCLYAGDTDGMSFLPEAFVNFVLFPVASVALSIEKCKDPAEFDGDEDIDIYNYEHIVGSEGSLPDLSASETDAFTRSTDILMTLQQASAETDAASKSDEGERGTLLWCSAIAFAHFASCFDDAIYNCERYKGDKDYRVRETMVQVYESSVKKYRAMIETASRKAALKAKEAAAAEAALASLLAEEEKAAAAVKAEAKEKAAAAAAAAAQNSPLSPTGSAAGSATGSSSGAGKNKKTGKGAAPAATTPSAAAAASSAASVEKTKTASSPAAAQAAGAAMSLADPNAISAAPQPSASGKVGLDAIHTSEADRDSGDDEDWTPVGQKPAPKPAAPAASPPATPSKVKPQPVAAATPPAAATRPAAAAPSAIVSPSKPTQVSTTAVSKQQQATSIGAVPATLDYDDMGGDDEGGIDVDDRDVTDRDRGFGSGSISRMSQSDPWSGEGNNSAAGASGSPVNSGLVEPIFRAAGTAVPDFDLSSARIPTHLAKQHGKAAVASAASGAPAVPASSSATGRDDPKTTVPLLQQLFSQAKKTGSGEPTSSVPVTTAAGAAVSRATGPVSSTAKPSLAASSDAAAAAQPPITSAAATAAAPAVSTSSSSPSKPGGAWAAIAKGEKPASAVPAAVIPASAPTAAVSGGHPGSPLVLSDLLTAALANPSSSAAASATAKGKKEKASAAAGKNVTVTKQQQVAKVPDAAATSSAAASAAPQAPTPSSSPSPAPDADAAAAADDFWGPVSDAQAAPGVNARRSSEGHAASVWRALGTSTSIQPPPAPVTPTLSSTAISSGAASAAVSASSTPLPPGFLQPQPAQLQPQHLQQRPPVHQPQALGPGMVQQQQMQQSPFGTLLPQLKSYGMQMQPQASMQHMYQASQHLHAPHMSSALSSSLSGGAVLQPLSSMSLLQPVPSTGFLGAQWQPIHTQQQLLQQHLQPLQHGMSLQGLSIGGQRPNQQHQQQMQHGVLPALGTSQRVGAVVPLFGVDNWVAAISDSSENAVGVPFSQSESGSRAAAAPSHHLFDRMTAFRMLWDDAGEVVAAPSAQGTARKVSSSASDSAGPAATPSSTSGPSSTTVAKTLKGRAARFAEQEKLKQQQKDAAAAAKKGSASGAGSGSSVGAASGTAAASTAAKGPLESWEDALAETSSSGGAPSGRSAGLAATATVVDDWVWLRAEIDAAAAVAHADSIAYSASQARTAVSGAVRRPSIAIQTDAAPTDASLAAVASATSTSSSASACAPHASATGPSAVVNDADSSNAAGLTPTSSANLTPQQVEALQAEVTSLRAQVAKLLQDRLQSSRGVGGKRK